MSTTTVSTYNYRLYFGNSVEAPTTSLDTLRLTQNREDFTIDKKACKLCLNGAKFYRRIYEPGLIEVEVEVLTSDNALLPSIQKVNELFLKRLVKMTVILQGDDNQEETIIAENYYVFETCPQLIKNNGVASLFVKLVIYSIDKLMTLDKYSKAYIAKKLGSGILMPESCTFGFNGSSLIKTNVDSLSFLKYDSSLAFKDPRTNIIMVATIPSEFIQPYLVQYNESFYDFMVRTSNRCGEFLYFEDGKLIMGLPETEEQNTIKDYESVTQASYSNNPLNVDLFYRDSVKDKDGEVKTLNFETSKKNDLGYPEEIFPDKPVYNAEVAHDEFLYPLIPDKWTNFNYEMGFDPEFFSGKSGKDFATALVLSLIANELKNTKTSVLSNAIDFAINMAAEWGAASAKCFWFINLHPFGTIDGLANKKYIKDQKYNYSEQQDSDRFVGFGTKDSKGWTNIDFYKNIRQHEQEQQKQIICIDMGVNFFPVKIGEKVKVDGLDGTYVVIRIDMVADTKWTHDYRKYDQTDSDIYTGKQSQLIYAIPTFKGKDDKDLAVPPISAPFYRKAGPQTAFVIDNEDPKYQGRVRIAYPWQSAKEQVKLALKEAEVGLEKANEDVDAANKLLQEISDALALMKLKKGILKELDDLSDEERQQKINELKAKVVEDEQLIEELTLPDEGDSERVLSFTELQEIFMRQAELERVKKEYEILKAVLKVLEESDYTDLDEEIEKIEKDLEAKYQEVLKAKRQQEIAKINKETKDKTLKDKEDAWKQELIQIASPWVRVATPSATSGGGTYFKPQKGDEVLVNYDNDNIERPYVVGSLFSKNVKTPEQRSNITTVKSGLLKGASTYIMSPNGHHIAFNDPPNGAKLMEGVQGALSTVVSLAGYGFDCMKDMTGGIHIGDRFGFYELSMSAHERKIKMNSPFGDVSIDAFTGITLNAPNGDIKINGKNVEITAGNNITIKSGENIQKPVPGHPTVGGKLGGMATGIVFGVTGGVVDSVVGPYLDMTFIRHFVEVILRPIEGTMQIRSNRYLKLEAGIDSFAQIPANRYVGEQKRNVKARGEIPFLAKTVDCLHFMDNKLNSFFSNYKTLYNNCFAAREKFARCITMFVEQDKVRELHQKVLEDSWAFDTTTEWDDPIKEDMFRDHLIPGDMVFEGETYFHKEIKLASLANTLGEAMYNFHKHVDTFDHLLDDVTVDVEPKMKELLKKAFDDRKDVRTDAWKDHYLQGDKPNPNTLFGSELSEEQDAYVGSARKFKRTVAAVFLAELAECDDYKMDPINAGGGIKAAASAAKSKVGGGAVKSAILGNLAGAAGAVGETANVVGRFLRNPFQGAQDGKYLKLMYKTSDVKEDRMDSEYHWHHFLAKMQKPKNAFLRKSYDSTFGLLAKRLQIDEFARIHDREVWADRGYGTILMSDKLGETRVFDSGAFTKEEEASKGNWDALILTLKSIK